MGECSFSVQGGLETPTSRKIDADLRAADEERQRIEAERAAKAEVEVRRREAEAARRRRRAAEWERSTLRRNLQRRWNRLPRVLAATPEYSFLIDADPRMWKSVIYESLIHGRGARDRFVVDDCVRVLHEHNIVPLESRSIAVSAIQTFLRELHVAGSVSIAMDPSGVFLKIRPVTDLLGAGEEAARERERQLVEAARREERQRLERERSASDAAARLLIRASRAANWRECVWFERVYDTWGHVPPAIQWDDLVAADSVTGPHQTWHAAIWLGLILGRPQTNFAIATALACVEKTGAEIHGDRGRQKVADYLTNMIQRGVLDGPRELSEALAGARYTVRDGAHQLGELLDGTR
jgi:hypothetical protein